MEVEPGVHLGSCDYDGDALLALFADTLCPTYFPDGQEYKLPMNPGRKTSLIYFLIRGKLSMQAYTGAERRSA